MSETRERVRHRPRLIELFSLKYRAEKGILSTGAALTPAFASALMGLIFALDSFVVSQAEDLGFWISLSSLIARGQPLYAEAFDIKDPIFLWSIGVAHRVLGPVGPYVFSAVIVASAGPLSFLALRGRGIPRVLSLLSSIFFLGVLTGPFGDAFRSSTLPIVLILAGLVAAQKQRWSLTGGIVATIFFTKMAYLPLGVGLGWLALSQGSRAVKQALWGFGLTVSMTIGALAFRGELRGYLEMVRLNFHYREVYSAVVGLPSGPVSRLDLLNSMGSNQLLLAILLLLVSIIAANQRNGHDAHFYIAAILTLLGIGAVFSLSLLWYHHLQPLAVFALIVFMVAIPPLLDAESATFSFLRSLATSAVLLLVLFAPNIGFEFPDINSEDISSAIQPQLEVPAEATALPMMSPYFWSSPTPFARLGPNDDMGLFAFLPRDWVLVCRFGGPYGFETPAMAAEMVSCIEGRPEVLFVSPGFFSLRRPGPHSDEFDALVERIMSAKDRNFLCEAVPGRSQAQICWRTSPLTAGGA